MFLEMEYVLFFFGCGEDVVCLGDCCFVWLVGGVDYFDLCWVDVCGCLEFGGDCIVSFFFEFGYVVDVDVYCVDCCFFLCFGFEQDL